MGDITGLTFFGRSKPPKAQSGNLFSLQLVDGVPDGEGKFTTENSSGIEWYYEGTFTQGAVTGNGVKCWPSW